MADHTPKVHDSSHESNNRKPQSRGIAHQLKHENAQIEENALGLSLDPPYFQTLESDATAEMPGGESALIQRMMSRPDFIQSTNNGEARKSIAEIDLAIQNYETLLAQLIPPSAIAKRDSLRLVLDAVNTYIDNKVQNDPTNTRIAPVRRFKQDVEYSIASIVGNLPTPAEIADVIDNDPDSSGSRDWVVAVSHAPSMVPEVKRYIAATGTRKGQTLKRLHAANTLQYILDAAFVDGAGIVAIRTLPQGNALAVDEVAILNACMEKTATLAIGKEILSRRFAIPLGNIDALEAGQPNEDGGVIAAPDVVDWTLPGLKHAYTAMTSLPQGHASNNASLQHIRRYTGSGGWHGADRMGVGYRGDEERVSADPRTFTDKVKGRGRNVFTGKNSIEQTVRHEVGHAVDAQRHFSDAYCVGNAAGGNWTVFASKMDIIADFLARKASAMALHPAYLGPVKYTVSTLLDDGANPDTIKADVVRQMTHFAGLLPAPFDPAIVRNDPVFAIMTQPNLKLPYTTAAPGHANNRTYVYSNANTMSSYDAGARARQVSNYQFRAPKEWFAEAYAAFYQPDNSPLGHGSVLQAADPATYNWFIGNVDINI